MIGILALAIDLVLPLRAQNVLQEPAQGSPGVDDPIPAPEEMPPEPVAAVRGEFQKVCPTCGIAFAASNPRQIHCSGACKTAAYRRRLAEGSASVAGEDIGIRVKRRPRAPTVVRKSMTWRCPICFAAVSSLGECCDLECAKIHIGLNPPPQLGGRPAEYE